MTALAWRPDWQSLLANGTVNNPAQNNLTGIIYATSRVARVAPNRVYRAAGMVHC